MPSPQCSTSESASSIGLLQVKKSQEGSQYRFLVLKSGQRVLKMPNGTFKVAPVAPAIGASKIQTPNSLVITTVSARQEPCLIPSFVGSAIANTPAPMAQFPSAGFPSQKAINVDRTLSSLVAFDQLEDQLDKMIQDQEFGASSAKVFTTLKTIEKGNKNPCF